MKPLILFDIDRTLFDTDKFHTLYLSRLLPFLHISVAEFEAARKLYLDHLKSSTDFLPKNYLTHLSSHFSVPYPDLYRLYYSADNFTSSLFPDVIPCLNSLSPDYSLGIFSEGYPSFQKAKLRKTGILRFFTPGFLHIHRRKLRPSILAGLPPDTIIVDDKLEAIKKLSVNPRLHPVWLNRRRQSSPSSITSVNLLTELPKISLYRTF